jgi:mRNA interferase MazF
MLTDRGDVVLVLFPDSNLLTYKRRPALVIQADQLSTGLPQTIVAMITSNPARAGHPSRWMVGRSSPEGRQMGLRTDSVVMTDNLATVRDSEIDRIVGRCSGMSHVDAALRHTLNPEWMS